MSVHTTLRSNWQTPVPSHLGVRLPTTPAPLEPSSAHSCEHSKARKMTQNASKNPTPPPWRTRRRMSRLKVRTARRDTATQSINCAHFSILRNGERTPWVCVHRTEKICEVRQKPPVEHVTTVEPSKARVPKIRRTPEATPKHRRTERYKGEGNVQISRCE